MAKVFIGMPVYNGERFLKEALESLCAQTFTDWRLFISDDVSTDTTRAICEEYVKKDQRITYFQQKQNLGMFPNLSFVLDRADADYFMWAAQDDVREKEYLTVCVQHLEKNSKLGLSTTVMAAIDSYGRTLTEERRLLELAEGTRLMSTVRYILQPEILGKCNLMYGLFRTEIAKSTWVIYPMRKVWGPDYHFSLALISRYAVFVDKEVLFKKRLGGFSSPKALINDTVTGVRKIEYKNPKNQMFPYGRFKAYFSGHMEALRGTNYRPLAALLLFIRFPRALFIHLKSRGTKKALFL